ncbi:carotenoid oxygenase family protein [Halomarina litorea]|uniref:carotenoid oxygenase family protein n=1 Tax=Halomarina litorea TaxID=2961595 RepID=UPI0020C3A144|nr:carotenoid oxygenase family protein [Halomarina sp. BCD28]
MADYRLGLRTLDEEVTTTLPVEGSLPPWLSGTLFVNGPGRFDGGEDALNHWFDGLAMLRRFEIEDGTVAYANRFLRSEEYEHVVSRNRLARGQFGTNPDLSLRDRLGWLTGPTLTDNASIGVDWVGGEFVAVTETPRQVAFDPETLATRGTRTFADALDVTGTLGHPHWDPVRDEMVNVGVRYGPRSEYVLHRRDRGSATREELGRVGVDRPAYFHSFALTERYAVLAEPPLVLSPCALLAGRPFVESFEWVPERGTRFTVFDRQTGRVVARPVADPFFVFHHANAYEAGDTLVVDLVAYEDASAVSDLSLSRLRDPDAELPAGEFRRYRISLGAMGATVESETLHPGPVEFPTIDYRGHNTRPYRYAYFAGNRERPPTTTQDRLLKVDIEAGEEVASWAESGCYPGEALFVPDPDGAAEDAGALLSVVLDADAERSFLLVLDARTLDGLARAPLPHALPFGFHGQFVRDLADPTRSMA